MIKERDLALSHPSNFPSIPEQNQVTNSTEILPIQDHQFYQTKGTSITSPSRRNRFYEDRGTSITYVSPDLIPFVEDIYIIKESRLETLRFLEAHSFLLPLLIEAYPNIQNSFPRSKVLLRVESELDEYDPDQLVASIVTDMDAITATNALTRFDRSWWLNAVKQSQGKICITLEF